MPRDTTRRSNASGAPQTELLQAVLDRAGIKTWSLLVVGDGSGTGWDDGCGWASILIDAQTRGRQLFRGGMAPASINMAELMPYYQALTWFHAKYGDQRLKVKGSIDCHIITDSQTIANWGNQTANLSLPLPNPGRPYHAGLRELVRTGYQLHYHWAPRDTSDLNRLADLIASLSRKAILAVDSIRAGISQRAAEAVHAITFCDPATGQPINLCDLNPQEENHASISANQSGVTD